MRDMTLRRDTQHGRIVAGIAQFEGDLLSEQLMSGLATVGARGRKRGRQPGRRPKSDRLALKVLRIVACGRSCRWIGRQLDISKNPVADIVKQHLDE